MRAFITILCLLLMPVFVLADDAKPKAAVFPLAGTASQDARDKVGFSLRMKLDHDGHFEPIDGPTMAELAGDKVIDLSAKPQELAAMTRDDSPVILIWGELDSIGTGYKLSVKTRDLREKDGTAKQISKSINDPTDLRFVIEEVLKNINGIGEFTHPVEESVGDDPKAKELWEKNPNLVKDGDFASGKTWRVLLRSEDYHPVITESWPETDKVVIYQQQAKAIGDNIQVGAGHNVLAMKLSKDVAESNGLACLSDAIPIKQHTRYRLQFKYKSDGPSLHVFVKGYVKGKDISKADADVESYRCQVPPSGPTHGKWETVVCDVNPQNVSGSPAFLKIDLYAYLGAGTVMFDDVQLKAVGEQTRHAVDDAIKPPAK